METLSATGPRVRGAYDTCDGMTFSDKEGSELILSMDLSVGFAGIHTVGAGFNQLF